MTTEQELYWRIYSMLIAQGCDPETAARLAAETAYGYDDHAQE